MYYDISDFDKKADDFGAKIRIIMGQRSNGKTYQVVKKIVDGYVKSGYTGLYVRRWLDDLKSSTIDDLFSKHNPDIVYRNHRFTLSGQTICRTVALTQSEHFKGAVISDTCKIILFDEIFAEGRELPDEFSKWQSVLSTTIRDRDDVTVYMVGNTVRRISTYFDNYGIDIKRLKKGEINLVTVKGDSDVKIAIDWCARNEYVTRNKSAYFVNISAQNMLIDGDFESSQHHTKRYQGVTFRRWENAIKLPICFMHNNVYLEMRIYNGVLMIKKGNPSKIIYTRNFTPDTKKHIYVTQFPFFTMTSGIDKTQNFIISSIRENRFLCENIEVGEIAQEMIGAKKNGG